MSAAEAKKSKTSKKSRGAKNHDIVHCKSLNDLAGAYMAFESRMKLITSEMKRHNINRFEIGYGSEVPISTELDILRTLFEKLTTEETFVTCEYTVEPGKTETMCLSFEDNGPGETKVSVYPLSSVHTYPLADR